MEVAPAFETWCFVKNKAMDEVKKIEYFVSKTNVSAQLDASVIRIIYLLPQRWTSQIPLKY
jgi:hypothetical protein